MSLAVTRLATTLALLLPLSTTAAPALKPSAKAATIDNGIRSEFIEFLTGPERGVPFYPIKINDKDEPYLNVVTILTLFELAPVCDLKLGTCKASNARDNLEFGMNIARGELTVVNNKTQKTTTLITPKGAIYRDSEGIWLRYDQWQNWVPIDVNWNADAYSLHFFPKFALLSDLKKQREDALATTIAAQKLQALIDKTPPLLPTRSLDGQVSLNNAMTINSLNQWSSPVTYQSNLDIFGGTLRTSGTITDAFVGNTPFSSTSSYEKRDPNTRAVMTLGTTSPQAIGRLVPSNSLTDAFTFSTVEQRQFEGDFHVSGIEAPGVSIEVWAQGFLKEIIKVPADGHYDIKDSDAHYGDVYRLVFYALNGTTRTENYTIVSALEQSLKKNTWDVDLAHGRTQEDRFTSLGIWYGLTDTITPSLKLAVVPLHDIDRPVQGASVNWQVTRQITAYAETLYYGAPTPDIELQARWQPENHSLSGHYRYMNNNHKKFLESNIPNLSGSVVTSPATSSIEGTQNNQYSFTDSFTFLDRSNQFELLNTETFTGVGHRITQSLPFGASSNIAGGIVWPQAATQTRFAETNVFFRLPFKTSASWRHSILSGVLIPTNYSVDQVSWNASWGHYYRSGLSFSYSKDNHGVTTHNWTYTNQIKPWLAVGLGYDTDVVSLVVSINRVLGRGPVGQDFSVFGEGTMYGHIYDPLTGDENTPPDPLEGVKLRAGGREAITDKDGFYLLEGVPANQRMTVNIDQNTILAAYAPQDPYTIAYLRPSTTIEYNPVITTTAGIDGNLIVKGYQYSPALKIEVTNLKTGLIVSTVDVDQVDGFFTVEGLIPGKYRLELKGTDTPPAPLEIEMPKGESWIPGLSWVWKKPGSNLISMDFLGGGEMI